uniref:Oxidation resistance protein 1 n=1 Tax=Aplanochytrium stocchinoi TaxID=215587 RepID=A0A7S3PRC9_9STRA|mmetsp:Transcript_153/g.164  ORF Transcript_153/g.164 Transcript_153/m.164 type:complete len:263 (-) Transcript_153:101-889(-)
MNPLKKRLDRMQRRLFSTLTGAPMIDVTAPARSDGTRPRGHRKQPRRRTHKIIKYNNNRKSRKQVRVKANSHIEPRMVNDSRHSSILSQRQLTKLWKKLPYRKRVSFWYMLYDSNRDGLSFLTLYNAVNAEVEAIMIMRTVEGDIFGFFSTEPWGLKTNSYYGTGESFLFSFSDSMKVKDKCDVYTWTGKNNCFMRCSDEYLAVGGGRKKGLGCAFYLDSDFHGSSRPCETFGNKSLVSSKGSSFVVRDIEVFGFRPCNRSR